MKTHAHVRHVVRPHVTYVRQAQRPRTIYADVATMIPDGMHGIEETYHNDGWRAGRPVTIYADVATMIPDGMHAAPPVDNSLTLASTVRRLIAAGVPPAKARDIVHRAHGRHLAKGHYKRSGLSGDEADVPTAADSGATAAAANALPTISADAQSVQAAHKRMIATMAGWEERTPGWVTTDDELRRSFQDQLTALKNQFVQRSLPVLGVEFPYQIERTDPAGAIVLAVRDDIQNTIDLLDQRKSQAILQKTISDLSKVPLPSAPPSINLKIPDVPWYVWAGASGVGLLALHQMLKK